jgi:hypothetical protein
MQVEPMEAFKHKNRRWPNSAADPLNFNAAGGGGIEGAPAIV